MVADYRYQYLQIVRSAAATVLMPLHISVNSPIRLIQSIIEKTQNHLALSEQNAALKKENFILKTQALTLDSLKTENIRLRALLGSSKILDNKSLIGKLLKIDLNPYSHKVTINQGSRAGISIGQPILDEYGIMGQVIELTPLTSTALLITDNQHATPGKIMRNGTRVIVSGTGGKESMLINHLSKTTDIRIGDLITTSGLANRFPEGYPIGRVEKIEQVDSETFLKVYIKPSAKINTSEYVLFTWPEHSHST